MIKKMMALLAAISCAIGAWADVSVHLSGTDFSGLSAGSFVTGLDDSGEETGSTYWFVGDTDDFEGTIVTNLLKKKFLDFESNITNPLYRTISGCYDKSKPDQFVTTPIGTGLFIDTTVQFTPYLVNENHPAPTKVTPEDKLIVWVRETEVEDGANVTNLIVTAGYLDVYGNVTPSNYVANLSPDQVSALCADEHRLTIKSFENITTTSGAYVMGFVVYLDQVPIEYAGNAFADDCLFFPLIATPALYYTQGGSNNKLFPSLLNYASSGTVAEYSKLSGVGYAGMGKIGDVFFDTYSTAYPAFAADDLNFKVVVGDGVSSFDYQGQTYTTDTIFAVPPATASVTISNVVYSVGYKHKTGTWHNGAVVNNQVDENGHGYGTFFFANGTELTLAGFLPNFIVNGEEFENLDEALVKAMAGRYPLVLNNDITITEGDGYLNLTVSEGTLTIDLNGHTIKGTSKERATIENAGVLTIVDKSLTKSGKVLASPYGASLQLYDGSETALDAGTYETIVPVEEEIGLKLVLNGGTYLDPSHVTSEDPFYLQEYVAAGKTVVDWKPIGDYKYAVIGDSGVTPVTYAVTFSTNNIEVAEYTKNIAAGEKLPVDAIPAFTGGAWDVDPTNAVINAATNFNYTIPPADPWAPDSKTDEAASNKVVEVFGEAVAEKIHTYDTYTNMVSYLKGEGVNDPDAFKQGGDYATQAPYVYQSYILGAHPLFEAEPKVTVTDVAANATTAGNWDFTVKVTEGESTDAFKVAADKVAALVKIRTSLTTGTWDAPTAGNIEAVKPDGGHLIKVTINFGNGTSGFMKVAE